MEPTICYNCKHSDTSDPGSDVWYNHFCIACPLPPVFNYVTGKQEPQRYAYCRDINTDGKCAKFERKICYKGATAAGHRQQEETDA